MAVAAPEAAVATVVTAAVMVEVVVQEEAAMVQAGEWAPEWEPAIVMPGLGLQRLWPPGNMDHQG